MKKSLPKRIIVISIGLIVVALGFYKIWSERAKTVRASGTLEITYNGVPLGDPIFTLDDFKPGDCEERIINVTNNGSFDAQIAVRSDNEVDNDLMSTQLTIVISENLTDLYGGSAGEKHLNEFFADSDEADGVPLSIVPKNQSTNYLFEVCFDIDSGNEFQEKKVVFDLVFGKVFEDSLKINEVYYQCDSQHGNECDNLPCNINAEISGNAAGSTNTIIMQIQNTCLIQQSNTSNISNNISISSNTGSNSISGTTGRIVSIITGTINSFTSIFNFGNINVASCDCCCDCASNDEWIEIFNPTDQAVDLQDWTIEDNSGNQVTITSAITINPGEFVLISKSLDTWNYWDEDPGAKKVSLGEPIGDGLDNDGDHLYLINPDGDLVDAVAWDNDTAVWDPAVPLVGLGSSIERLTPGFDTELVSDWEERNPPTPGN